MKTILGICVVLMLVACGQQVREYTYETTADASGFAYVIFDDAEPEDLLEVEAWWRMGTCDLGEPEPCTELAYGIITEVYILKGKPIGDSWSDEGATIKLKTMAGYNVMVKVTR